MKKITFILISSAVLSSLTLASCGVKPKQINENQAQKTYPDTRYDPPPKSEKF